jgi:hypothetical protein
MTQDTILRACMAAGHVSQDAMPAGSARRLEVRDPNSKTSYYVCAPCWNAGAEAAREARRAQLDALPRCESCRKHRANYDVNGLGLCGRCLRRVRKAHNANCNRIGGLALFFPITYSRADYLSMAQGKEHHQ